MRYKINNVVWKVLFSWTLSLLFFILGLIFLLTIIFIPIGLRFFHAMKFASKSVYYKTSPYMTIMSDDLTFFEAVWKLIGFIFKLIFKSIGFIFIITIIFAPIGIMFFNLADHLYLYKETRAILDIELIAKLLRKKEDYSLESKIISAIYKNEIDLMQYGYFTQIPAYISDEIYEMLDEHVNLRLQMNAAEYR